MNESNIVKVRTTIEALDKITESRDKSVEVVASFMGRSKSTVYGWLSGRPPSNDATKLLIIEANDWIKSWLKSQ